MICKNSSCLYLTAQSFDCGQEELVKLTYGWVLKQVIYTVNKCKNAKMIQIESTFYSFFDTDGLALNTKDFQEKRKFIRKNNKNFLMTTLRYLSTKILVLLIFLIITYKKEVIVENIRKWKPFIWFTFSCYRTFSIHIR